jgi:arylsulfatase A-like enzyme
MKATGSCESVKNWSAVVFSHPSPSVPLPIKGRGRFALFVRAVLVVFICVVLFGSLGVQAATKQPNVVLFLVDDMGWMDSGAYGSKYYETPNIDKFAKRAMRFTNAYSQPLCSPTRASILTGQYSARHGITSATGHQPPQPAGHKFIAESGAANQAMLLPESKNFLEPTQITLAETLKAAGYRTAHIGKWHLGLTQPHWPEQQGFDVTFHCHPDPGPPGEYFSPYGVKAEGVPGGRNKVGNITDGPEGEYIVDRQAAEAVKFIQNSKGGPFYLNLWCYGVHGPWGHKEEYTKYFANKKDPTGRQGNPIMASMLKSVDECFGRIVDELEKQGVADNTIVIFYSDNGGNVHSNMPATAKTAKAEKAKSEFLTDWRKWAGDQPPTMNTPLRDGKGTLYEGGTRVPLMWAWAGKIKLGTTSDAVVGPIDVYPTVIDLLGIKKPAQQVFDGVSYAKILKSEGALERKAYFNYHPHAGANRAGGVWVRSGDFKLLRWFGNPSTHELYNLREDISEAKNLVEAMPEKVKELSALIDGFLKDTGATYPRPNPGFQAKPVAAGKAAVGDDLQGWVPKGVKTSMKEGALHIEADGRMPFIANARLGTLKNEGTVNMTLRVRSATGGEGKVQWRTSAQETFVSEGQVATFKVPAGNVWNELPVRLDVTGAVAHVRVYVPAQNGGLEVDWIKVAPAGKGKEMSWDFGGAAK